MSNKVSLELYLSYYELIYELKDLKLDKISCYELLFNVISFLKRIKKNEMWSKEVCDKYEEKLLDYFDKVKSIKKQKNIFKKIFNISIIPYDLKEQIGQNSLDFLNALNFDNTVKVSVSTLEEFFCFNLNNAAISNMVLDEKDKVLTFTVAEPQLFNKNRDFVDFFKNVSFKFKNWADLLTDVERNNYLERKFSPVTSIHHYNVFPEKKFIFVIGDNIHNETCCYHIIDPEVECEIDLLTSHKPKN